MRCFSIFTAIVSVLGLTCCAAVIDEQKMTRSKALALVETLPDSPEKQTSLAVIRNAATKYRVDDHGLPAWTWRGVDDIGACVHIDPKTGKPYLETQFSKLNRKSSPKYIDFGTDGKNWMCRTHIKGLGVDIERNSTKYGCHQEGKNLLIKLSTALEM